MAVTYTQELLDRATAWLDRPLTTKRNPEGLTELAGLIGAFSGQEAGGCKQCQYSDYAQLVRNYQRQATRFLHPDSMATSKYTLAPGYENEQFVHDSYGKAVTADNLEDADAEFFIKHGYKHAFVEKAASKKEVEGPKLTEKQQAQADYKATFGVEPDAKLTIKELQDATAKKVAKAPAGDADTAPQTGATEATGDSTGPADVDPK